MIHHLFEQVVENRAACRAVIDADRAISYAELNARANLLAYHFRLLGVGRGCLVAIHLDRSIELIVAVVAVLKAGAGYVPLATDQPPERLGFILHDTAAQFVITRTDRLQLPGIQVN